MTEDKCNFFSENKCMTKDLEPCDFIGDNFKECIRYKLYFLRPPIIQLR